MHERLLHHMKSIWHDKLRLRLSESPPHRQDTNVYPPALRTANNAHHKCQTTDHHHLQTKSPVSNSTVLIVNLCLNPEIFHHAGGCWSIEFPSDSTAVQNLYRWVRAYFIKIRCADVKRHSQKQQTNITGLNMANHAIAAKVGCIVKSLRHSEAVRCGSKVRS